MDAPEEGMLGAKMGLARRTDASACWTRPDFEGHPCFAARPSHHLLATCLIPPFDSPSAAFVPCTMLVLWRLVSPGRHTGSLTLLKFEHLSYVTEDFSFAKA